MADKSDYPFRLADIAIGTRFRMLNYEDQDFMRVDPRGVAMGSPKEGSPRWYTADGLHLLIIGLGDGIVFGMSREKPCRKSDARPETQLEKLHRQLRFQKTLARFRLTRIQTLKDEIELRVRLRNADLKRIDNLLVILRRAYKTRKVALAGESTGDSDG